MKGKEKTQQWEEYLQQDIQQEITREREKPGRSTC